MSGFIFGGPLGPYFELFSKYLYKFKLKKKDFNKKCYENFINSRGMITVA